MLNIQHVLGEVLLVMGAFIRRLIEQVENLQDQPQRQGMILGLLLFKRRIQARQQGG